MVALTNIAVLAISSRAATWGRPYNNFHMDPISTFNQIRDVPYYIPLTLNEKDRCCAGKHKMLKAKLEEAGLATRYRVCLFCWSALKLPPELLAIPHDDDCTHVFLEIKIDGRWVKVDATWDSGVKKILPVNNWDGRSDTPLAVPAIEIFSPEKSERIMRTGSDEKTLADLRVNGRFYQAFNKWLEVNRQR